ncbi:MAG: ribosome-associated translation inhibitor RaiA [Alphaproteobacteria bacterium]|nr:ribosome-associated translation inhibitor RaiA [Rhodospirillales bacterium]MCW9045288.1 ribosome-associated translation inhibitor RaiA [Alphaproteobacteria bacterium]
MKLEIKGKKIDVGDSLRTHMEENLNARVSKYFNNASDATISLSKLAHNFRVDVTVHVGRNIEVQGRGEAEDPYAAFDGAMERIGKQLRRYKRRLKNHHNSKAQEEYLAAQQYVIAPEDDSLDSEPEADQPTIVAEMAAKIETLTVSEAVMRMDLADLPTIMFRNSAHGGLNVVYKRNDGHIGWIDPSLVS